MGPFFERFFDFRRAQRDSNPRPTAPQAAQVGFRYTENHDIDWRKFHDWLVSQGKAKRTVKTNVQYAKRFYSVLDTGDASPLATLPGTRSREIALVALANYAKYTGRYERFQELKRRYALKWSTANSTQFFERFFNPELTLDVMLQRIRQMIRSIPRHMAAVVKFNCLTGLRASEAIESVRLLNVSQGTTPYYNEERQALEHFRHPEIFLRTTKKAYISYLSSDMYDYFTKNCSQTPPTWNAISLTLRRRGLPMEMYLCRKVFASWLRKEGIQPEIVDLLQGRVSQSILVRHYLAPSAGLADKVLAAVDNLHKILSFK